MFSELSSPLLPFLFPTPSSPYALTVTTRCLGHRPDFLSLQLQSLHSRSVAKIMLCTFCSRPAVTTCESGCGQRFCDYVEHQEVHRDAAGGQCHPFLVKEAEGVGR